MQNLIIGGSHAIQFAQFLGKPQLLFDDISNIFKIENDGHSFIVAINSQSAPLIQMHNGRHVVSKHLAAILNDSVFDAVYYLNGGNEHNSKFFTVSPDPFDFISHLGPNRVVPNRRLLDFSEVSSLVQSLLLNLKHELTVFSRNVNSKKSFFICPPPPIPDNNHIIKHPELFDFNLHNLEDKYFRLKIYNLYVSILKNIVIGFGFEFLFDNANKIDEEGFLLPEYWFGCTHATPDYYKNIF